MKDNCLDCLYAIHNEISILFEDKFKNNTRICDHQNSPYYKEYVDNETNCRLFINEKNYFRNKELKEKINNLKNKLK